jgi:Na+/H+-dicarboxylate symporter
LIIMLAICLGLSALFASDLTEWMRPLLRRTFEAGFEIIGWVILWHPIQVLVFAPVAIRVRLAALRRFEVPVEFRLPVGRSHAALDC